MRGGYDYMESNQKSPLRLIFHLFFGSSITGVILHVHRLKPEYRKFRTASMVSASKM